MNKDVMRIAVIALLAVVVAKLVLPRVPGLDRFAGYL